MDQATEQMIKRRFRYLEKYIGTYRVLPELTYDGDFPRVEGGGVDPSYDDIYIPCSKGRIVHTYQDGILAWLMLDKPQVAKNVYKALTDKYGDKLELQYEDCGADTYIFFKEEDIKKIATIVKPKTAGAKVSPFSTKNLPTAGYKIPDDDLARLSDVMTALEQTEKLKYGKLWLKEFDTVIQKKKGKKYNIENERDLSGMKPKQFIHYIGLWEDYIKYVDKQVKGLKKKA